ncbi:eye-specific diacylglycerol kinase isoform X3 [Frankliniella occidentalis]|uniref:Diacylglycerol kinase n=1 Tax=Frankliniella occidentalis TaxID=133901 RepID=A0A9C6WUX3_FRAOC|nr:eye-specific diacylglycerol kinase isoform X3 [Frankliniella occidentalis]
MVTLPRYGGGGGVTPATAAVAALGCRRRRSCFELRGDPHRAVQRRRFGSLGGERPSAASSLPAVSNSGSCSTGSGTLERHRRPSYPCAPYTHRRHYAIRRRHGYRRAVGAEGAQREFRATPDWAESAVNGDHLWSPTTQSGDMCYVGEPECTKHGPRYKCAACKIVAHQSCVPVLIDRLRFTCKATFRDVGVRAYREQASTAVTHHWVHRRSQKGKCRQCGKSFQSKLSFSNKEIVALSCSWCKTSYHNKEACFNLTRIGEECTLGSHKTIVVPPSWIVKLPRRGSFKSSLRKSPKKKGSSKKKSKEKAEKEPRAFVIKPIPTANVRPVIVFINPKSGGNQGVKLLQKFQWHLNPRQVFDLTQGGPKMGLELFRKVPNLRVLACGGDGTVGWVLSVLDQLTFHPPPAVGVLPLGTGNDLARALGWGGGYTDEPISKILSNIGNSETVLLDRWQLKVEKNNDAKEKGDGKEQLPLSVVNNYFSMGVDAHIALEFHEAREAHPEKFNSRLRNKMFYGQMGGKDLVRRKWKGLAELVTLECDGKDLTPKLKDHRVHAIVFLNIPSYGGGTHPWNRAFGIEQATDDGLIEVVGLTTYQLPLLQAGGHGTCIAQCRTARIVTSKTIPMQVDGEACKLEPSVITLSLLNQATMLAKRRGGRPQAQSAAQESVRVSVLRINMPDYEQHHYEKELLAQAALVVGEMDVSPAADLEQVRAMICKLDSPNVPPDWCFVDSCTAERFFRVDRAQEHLHFLMDIAGDQLFILEEAPDVQDAAGGSGGSGGSGAATKDVSRETSQETSQDVSQEVLSPSDDQSTSDRASPDPLTDDTKDTHAAAPAAMAAHAPHHSYTPVYSTDGVPYASGHGGDSAAGSSRTQQKLFGLNYVKYSHLLEKSSEEVLRASRENDLRRLRDLHQQGYSMLSIDAVGQTALHISGRADHRDIVKYLLANAPPSIVDIPDTERGQTALQVAAAAGRRSVCCLLVAAGASLIVKDRQGRTAKQLARAAGDETLADYLESQERFHLVTEDVETIV